MSLLERNEPKGLLPDIFLRWFQSRGWTPRAHQLELLAKAEEGRSVLLIAPTGGGKTLAGFLPTLVELYEAAAHEPRSLPRLPGRVGEGADFGEAPPPDRLRRSTSPASGGGEERASASLAGGG